MAVGVPTLWILVAGWNHRWIGDDGLIYTRVVRQILAGNGPVYNVGERVETSTGTLWQWLVAAATLPTGMDPAKVAVCLGLALCTTGFALALLGTLALHGRPARVVPLGVLALLPVQAMWDYATSGLETGLAFCWLGATWWTLVHVGRTGRHLTWTAVLLGLGPLVRPDLALVTGLYAAVLFALVRPGWRRGLSALAAGLALPVGYEIFRAGYYGILVPLPAITKEASWTLWDRGLYYLADFVTPYHLWLPLVLLAALSVPVAAALREAPDGRRALIIAATPVGTGLASALFVTKVGGDFMHGRMLLPALFLVLLPGFLVPLTRITASALAAVVVWAGACLLIWRPPYKNDGISFILDEHAGYVGATGQQHPVTQAAHAARGFLFAREVRRLRAEGERVVLIEMNYDREVQAFPLSARHRPAARFAGMEARLGHAGVAIPLDEIAVDYLGLSNPLGAHMQPTIFKKAGHEKPIKRSWVIADYTDPAATDSPAVRAARHALTCGAIAELQDSVRAPLTPGRFWQNLTGAWERTRLRIPADPVAAEKEFCVKPAPAATAAGAAVAQ
ncbi:hypothetical protein G6045_17020 [Streptomyces sp. YC504]|uniref:Terminal beta-(1->2)-arabinofuranosyltransferase C-terminal domain-containing protein n=1 Tax=Streptomyces mesophilus TaxID=1775132 RepID=A0A6G4XIG7_9ACTN|nr:hypothetical protein [Streptomyces mesophilus]NGO77349.1 hypothetical protein [Streptomyces mesophilus]